MSEFTVTTAAPVHSTVNWPLFLRRFLPLFVIAAIMPVVLQTAFTFSSAERANELRIWLEPETVITQPNKPVQFKIMAQFEDEARLLSTINFSFATSPLLITPTSVNYTLPFRGTTAIGEVTTSAPGAGSYELAIPVENVVLSNSTGVTIITTPAKIIVKNPQ